MTTTTDFLRGLAVQTADEMAFTAMYHEEQLEGGHWQDELCGAINN